MNDIDTRELAVAHRIAVWVMVAGFIAACTKMYFALAAIPLHMYAAWRVGRAVKYHPAVIAITILLMLIPVVNTLTVFLLNSKPGQLLKRAGLPIGPMGIKTQDLPAKQNSA